MTDPPSTLPSFTLVIQTSQSAKYSSDSCDVESLFTSQTLTIDITLCGDFAGSASKLALTCPALSGDNTCYSTYVINDQSSTFANSYHEINYINVISSSGSTGQSLGNAMGTVMASMGAGTGTGSSGASTSGGERSVWGTGMAGLGPVLLSLGVAVV
ncbi:hypothetical protein IAR50_005409 [Cryptococcus sp. DSM 104548]